MCMCKWIRFTYPSSTSLYWVRTFLEFNQAWSRKDIITSPKLENKEVSLQKPKLEGRKNWGKKSSAGGGECDKYEVRVAGVAGVECCFWPEPFHTHLCRIRWSRHLLSVLGSWQDLASQRRPTGWRATKVRMEPSAPWLRLWFPLYCAAVLSIAVLGIHSWHWRKKMLASAQLYPFKEKTFCKREVLGYIFIEFSFSEPTPVIETSKSVSCEFSQDST